MKPGDDCAMAAPTRDALSTKHKPDSSRFTADQPSRLLRGSLRKLK